MELLTRKKSAAGADLRLVLDLGNFSTARNEATASSDVDLLVEFNRQVGYFGLFALQDYLEKQLGCPVDLGTPDSLKPYIRERIKGEMIRVT